MSDSADALALAMGGGRKYKIHANRVMWVRIEAAAMAARGLKVLLCKRSDAMVEIEIDAVAELLMNNHGKDVMVTAGGVGVLGEKGYVEVQSLGGAGVRGQHVDDMIVDEASNMTIGKMGMMGWDVGG